MKILRPNRVVKSAIFSLAVLSLFFFNSCKKLVDSVDTPYIPGASSGGSRSILAPSEPTATQGAKQKITLSWDSVDNAVYYHIYYADNANDEFVKLDETEKNFYEDKVAAGTTVYYKIIAEKSDGELSEFSKTVKGTSLAVPTFYDGDFGSDYAKLSWYMQNAVDERTGQSNYQHELQFLVTCREEGGMVFDEKQLDGNQTTCEFTGLSSETSYVYSVSAFLLSAQNETEDSPEVNAATLLSYTPQEPKEVTASQGTSKSGIEIKIKLPPKVQTNAKKKVGNEQVKMLYPLYFEIERAEDGSDKYDSIIKTLYCNGKTIPPTYTYSETDPCPEYKEGMEITYFDSSTELERGKKYKYRVRSWVDNSYDKVIGASIGTSVSSDYKSSRNYSKDATGWKLAELRFEHVAGYPLLEGTKVDNEFTKIDSISLKYKASWSTVVPENASEYKFAIEQTRYLLQDSRPKDKEEWLTGNLFDSIGKINTYFESNPIIFSDLDNENQKGYYRYTLYIVPADCDVANIKAKAYDFVSISDDEIISSDVRKAKVIIKGIKGGYKKKIEITFQADKEITYRLERTVVGETTVVNIPIGEVYNSSKPDYTYSDTSVESGVQYEYKLLAKYTTSAVEPSINKIDGTDDFARAWTLGEPKPEFIKDKKGYDSVTVKLPKDPCATKYEGWLENTNNKFSFEVGKEINATGATVTVDGNNFNITVKAPDTHWKDAAKAGTEISFKAKVHSDVDEYEMTTNLATCVLGPANINLRGSGSVSEGKTGVERDKITVKWNAVEGAAAYLVVRRAEGDNVDDIYIVKKNGDVSVETGDKVADAINVTVDEQLFTLVDKQTKAIDEPQKWNANQDRIAWGLEYTYKVFPLLNEEASVQKAVPSKYTKNVSTLEKSGYTKGYGLEVEASKADYPRQIKLTWNIPVNAQNDSNYYPIVCYRTEGGSETWNSIVVSRDSDNNYTYSKATDGKTAYCLFKPDASRYLTSKMECLVFYRENSDAPSFVDSYITYSAKDKDGNDVVSGKTEGKNCGYMFSMPKDGMSATKPTSDTFEEKLSWLLYENEGGRLNKPGDNMNGAKPYTLYVRNYNIKNTTANSNNWFPLAKFDVEGKNMELVSSTWYDVTATSNAVGKNITVDVTPGTVDDTDEGKKKIHNGLLKVLRDYKHYYKIVGERKNSEGAVITTSTLADEEDVAYTFRQITEAELMKAGVLVFATGIDGFALFDASHNVTGAGGGSVIGNRTGGSKSNDYKVKFSDYTPLLSMPTGGNAALLSLTTPEFTAYRGNDGVASYNGGINNVSATVSPVVSELSDLTSYSGTITVKLDSDKNNYLFVCYRVPTTGTVTCGTASVSGNVGGQNSPSEFKKTWFPWKLYERETTDYDSSGAAYGWWDEH